MLKSECIVIQIVFFNISILSFEYKFNCKIHKRFLFFSSYNTAHVNVKKKHAAKNKINTTCVCLCQLIFSDDALQCIYLKAKTTHECILFFLRKYNHTMADNTRTDMDREMKGIANDYKTC